MKKYICILLCAVMLLGALPVFPALAASGDQGTIQEVVGALDIITGDENGNLNLSSPVTRAEFAKMLVSASEQKDLVSPVGNSSPFRDVPYTHWAASYIKTAVAQGWITGYLDGTFRPENTITVAEAATAVLKLLGYTSTDFSGSYPHGQMALYQSLGLSDGISGGQSSTMTRQNCMRLFYNLLSVKTKDGSQKYTQVLGYALDSDGNPDYNDILQSTTDGPVIMTGDLASALSFAPSTIYRNDALSSADALQQYDVLYYSASRGTVWAYSRRVTGTLEAVSPNRESPTAVTIAGITYDVTGASAQYHLGASGGLSIGSNVTALLGKSGDVVEVYAATQLQEDIIGVVTAISTGTYTAANGAAYTSPTLLIRGLNGEMYTVPYSSANNYSTGSLVKVTYTASDAVVSNLSQNSLSGKVSAAEGTIGTRKIAGDVQILDYAAQDAVKIYLNRIDGITLSSSNTLYHSTNAAGEIDAIILNDLTGDRYAYGIVLSASERYTASASSDASQASIGTTSGSYRFLIDGAQSSMSTASSSLGASAGPARFTLSNGQVTSVRSLYNAGTVTAYTTLQVAAADGTYTLSDQTAFYLFKDMTYSQIDRNTLNTAQYNIRAYYDKPDSEGGRVRVIIATEK